MRTILAALILFFIKSAAASGGKIFYVATSGNDAWSGQLAAPNEQQSDGPLRTLESVRDKVRALRKNAQLPATGIAIEVRGGTYYLKQPFALTAEDSGTKDAPIIYRVTAGEVAYLNGGTPIGGFVPVTDETILNRLDPAARGKVSQTNLRAQGVTNFGQIGDGGDAPDGPGLELIYDSKPMTLARGPNQGFITIKQVLDKNASGGKCVPEGKFIYEGDRPARWKGEKDPRALGYWCKDWVEERQKIEATDPQQHSLSLSPPYHAYGYRAGQWFYGFNILAELDTPGEWYLDRETAVLYFWPPPAPKSAKAVVSMLPNVLSMNKTSDVTFRGFVFEGARGTAIKIQGGARNQIIGCKVRNSGGWAIRIEGGIAQGVRGCDISGTGDGGISIESGVAKTLSTGGSYATNNYIHDWSRWNRMMRPAIRILGAANSASHNLIENGPHIAILFSGNDQLIEYNEIRNVCYEARDAGAIYAGLSWTMRGSQIRFNYLHDITGLNGRGCVGVYLDDMYSGTAIFGNVFYNVPSAAFVGGGRDNVIQNNLFIYCNPAVHVDSRGLGWARRTVEAWVREGREKGTLLGVGFNKPPYSNRYPQLAKILEDEPAAPKGTLIANNINVGGKWDDVDAKAKPYVVFRENILDLDSHFFDLQRRDFRLPADSPVYQRGFRPIPIEKIGLVDDGSRASADQPGR